MGKKFAIGMGIKQILPDTNVLILGFKNEEPYASFLRKAITEKKLVFSSVVVAEYLVGATDDQEKVLNALTSQFKVLPVDLPVAQLGAFYRKKYIKRGKKLALPDCFIGATCKIYNLVLLTLDKKDFPMQDIEIIEKI
ncbi:PIN domain-containing protein [Candidatus Roizmanbacteria bacterium]|nr:PIN domain-containing protein [Candidatus Roizmanbacteria bacterium]